MVGGSVAEQDQEALYVRSAVLEDICADPQKGRDPSHFGEDHHSRIDDGTVDIHAPSKSIGSMEQGKPLTATDSPLVDFDAVCQRVRAAIEPARVHAVSLHDEKGDVLWLTESSMGPDEHNAAREGFETFTRVYAAPVVAYDL